MISSKEETVLNRNEGVSGRNFLTGMRLSFKEVDAVSIGKGDNRFFPIGTTALKPPEAFDLACTVLVLTLMTST